MMTGRLSWAFHNCPTRSPIGCTCASRMHRLTLTVGSTRTVRAQVQRVDLSGFPLGGLSPEILPPSSPGNAH